MSQISYIKYADVKEARRYDAEYFKPFNLLSEKLITNLNFSNLENLGKFIIGPFGSTIKVEDYTEKKQYKYIRGKDVKNGVLIDVDNSAITKEKFDSLPKYHLKNNDILITVVGTLGNVAIYRDSFGPAIFSCKSTIFRSNKIKPEFLMIFLDTKYGKSLLMRNERGAIQKGFNLPDLKHIPVPIFSDKFYESIDSLVLLSHQKQTRSKQLYREAEEILLRELGLLNYTVKHNLAFATTKKEIDQAGRYDAEYFQPKYKKIIEKIENYEGGCDVAGEIVKWKKGIEVGTDAYMETGKDFIRVSDFSIYGISESNRKISDRAFEDLKKNFQPKQGEILFTKDGTIGISYALKEDIEGILSGAFLRLTLKEKYKNFEKECLSLILSSILCKMQVEKLSGGALIAHLKPSDFETFKIPLIKSSIQKQIAGKIQESHKLRKESKELLEEAKRKVEEEIEK